MVCIVGGKGVGLGDGEPRVWLGGGGGVDTGERGGWILGLGVAARGGG